MSMNKNVKSDPDSLMCINLINSFIVILLTLVMLRHCIDGLICKLPNYLFINFKISHLFPQGSDFDDLYIKIIRGASGFDF